MKVTDSEVNQCLGVIMRMEAQELDMVFNAFKQRRETLNHIKVRTLTPGMRVMWEGKHGHTRGTIVKVKQKWVEVLADKRPGEAVGMKWNVVAGILRPETTQP